MREELAERVEAARRELAALRPGAWHVRSLVETTEGRAVVEFVAGGERLVGKLFAERDGVSSNTDGEAAVHKLERVSSWKLSTLRVPRAVLWCAAPRVLICDRAQGRACATIESREWPEVMPRIGRALRELHDQPLGPALRMQLADHQAELVRPAPKALVEAFPEHAGRVERTLERLRDADERWGELPMTWLHRDFQLRQLFDDGHHVTVVDWDDMSHGDAAFDVGYFTAYLKTHHAADQAEAGIAAFRLGYGGDDAMWSRVPVYERFNFLRRACRRLRLQDEGWRDELAAMMSRLDQG